MAVRQPERQHTGAILLSPAPAGPALPEEGPPGSLPSPRSRGRGPRGRGLKTTASGRRQTPRVGAAARTWYWRSWRSSGQARKWLRCMDRARAPPCGELSSEATACSRRTDIPVTSGLPRRASASSWPRACCSARAAGRAPALGHREPGLSGKICGRGGWRSAGRGPQPPSVWSPTPPTSRPCKALHSRNGEVCAKDPSSGLRARASPDPANLPCPTGAPASEGARVLGPSRKGVHLRCVCKHISVQE